MRVTVNGAGGMNSSPAIKGTVSIKGGAGADTQSVRIREAGNKVKKRLNYNHKEISGQLVRAKKAGSAATVLTRAKSKLAVLQRSAGSGQYDEKEMTAAIAHARRMIRCAQLKVKNLKEEELEQKRYKNGSGAETQQKDNEVKRRIAQKERQLKSKISREEIQSAVQEKSRRQQILQKRRMHRNEEQEKINEADMKYIKGQMENNSTHTSASQNDNEGVLLELSSAAAALTEIQMMQQEAELEQSAVEGMADTTAFGIGAAVGEASIPDGAAVSESFGGMVDISI